MANSQLKKFIVSPKLTVGPTRVQKQRIVTSYRIGADVFELIYRWEEDVFEPGVTADENLAAVIGAQVALNYGLFFEEISFIGPFSNSDRAFLTSMAKNTAKEIFINKLLKNNQFINDEIQATQWEMQKSYLNAKLTFSEEYKESKRSWLPEENRVAVLSSGGKESLLSHGLLKEVGCDVHPIYINESGRHWFTALNAYRYFRDNVTNTSRVWTNADRAYNWFLRHFPFVRQDFATKRADDYPIRLWTVAVFLFGALPMLRKRAIGYLVIGDEYDTTRRRNKNGVIHYDGLYDQSKFFDNALSQYFQKKRWYVGQFSILRSMSELLIEKVLVERYPELQRLQVSCHAAHTDGSMIRPCGRCEKCRRIIGMLTALDANPANCGYKREQVNTCLDLLAKEGGKLEAACASHVAHILNSKNLIKSKAKAHPEIMKLRFDGTCSPINAIPQNLRRPLFELLLQHADGALMRTDHSWEDIAVLSCEELEEPYPFDIYSRAENDDDDEYRWGVLKWPEVKRRLEKVDLAMLPIGSCEQHGPHLPLDTDSFDAALLAEQVARRSSQPRPLVLPLVPYGVSYHHDCFEGTLSVGPEALSRIVYDIGMSAARQGINKLVIVNGHGGNGPALQFACQRINRDARIFTCVESGETSDTDVAKLTETKNDVHAGEIETSTSLYLRPKLVEMQKAKRCVPEFSSKYLDFSFQRSVDWYARVARFSPDGVIGDPSKASSEKGEKIWSLIVKRLLEFIEDLKSLSLEEIYSRKY